ncbi:MAG: hypothetical protein ACLT2J_14055 [[Clostridium] innocuum]|jgi:hypothetical protein|nr:hypothetical protein [[Clostridium] innocuum]MCR0454096.1 hypothetical protein [[Clostridium] innocuum]MCR0568173.1 hypothetical protein [[Clostridium] innocuum]MDU1121275.1 hypothetical protein [Erysipelotrichaceae bacterium]
MKQLFAFILKKKSEMLRYMVRELPPAIEQAASNDCLRIHKISIHFACQ